MNDGGWRVDLVIAVGEVGETAFDTGVVVDFDSEVVIG